MSGQDKKPGIIIGTKGVQYGLQKVVPKKPGMATAAAAPAARKPAMFGDDDSDEEEAVGKQIARQAEKKRSAAKVQAMYEQALAEDPSAFDYDGVYDSMQAAKVVPKQQDKVERQSKYIAALLEQTQARKREQDVLYERRMVKERQQEDHLYEDKERFVTSAYRRKLEEDKKWQEAEKRKEAEEAKRDVRKVGHMGNFYANLLTKNVAYGAPTKEGGGEGEAAAGADGGAADPGRDRTRSASPGAAAGEAAPGGGRSGSQQRSASPEQQDPSAKVLGTLDRYDVLRLEAEKALREKKRREQEQKEQQGQREGEGAAAEGAAPSRQEQGEGRGEERVRAAGERRDAEGVSGGRAASGTASARGAGGEGVVAGGGDAGGGGGGAAGAGPAAAAAAAKRRNDDTSVMSARERYLARKMQKTG